MNTLFSLAPNLAALLLMLLGGAGMLFPKSIASFIGIQPISATGISEIRATLGSFFMMLGATCLWLQSTDAFTVFVKSWGGFNYIGGEAQSDNS